MTRTNEVFRALSDPTRRAIVCLLRSGDRSAGEIAQAFPLAKSTLSAHFNVLKHAGLIVAERHGTSISYRLDASVLEDLVTHVMGWLDVGRTRRAPDAQAHQAYQADAEFQAGRRAAGRPERGAGTSTRRTGLVRAGLVLLAGRLGGGSGAAGASGGATTRRLRLVPRAARPVPAA